MKNIIIRFLYLTFGHQRYLRFFTRFKIRFLRFDKRKSDYLFFEKILAANANIVVIGANTGITTIPFAKEKTKREIYAYEPLPLNYDILTYAIDHYNAKNIRSYRIALGDKKGNAQLILPKLGGTKKHGMAHISSETIKPIGIGETFTIKMDQLDNREELQNIRLAAIKLVAENFETEILMGAKKLIEKNRPIIYCELWQNENRKRAMHAIRSLNYEIYYRAGKELKPFQNSTYQGKNFFLKPIDE